VSCHKATLAPRPCLPAADTSASAKSVLPLAGRYDLTLVANLGPKAGDSSRGHLEIWPQEPPGPPGTTSVAPRAGAAKIDLAHVGARAPGDIESRNPSAPGVLVIDRHQNGLRTLLRFGSEANRSDRQSIEAVYTVLEVSQGEMGWFSGVWRSGFVEVATTGFFCAVRTS